MARMKVTLMKGDDRKAQKIRMRVEVHAVPAEPPAPVEEAPPTPGKMERRKVEAKKLEDIRRLLELSPTQQLAQMTAEARASTSGREEPARKKLQLTVRGKASQKFLKARKVKKPQRYWPGQWLSTRSTSSKRLLTS